MDKTDLDYVGQCSLRSVLESVSRSDSGTPAQPPGSANGRIGSPLAFGNSADVILDGGVGGGSPVNRMYFLNTDYLAWRPHSKRNMVPLDKGRYSTNQDAMVQLLVWAGNLC